MGKSITPPYRIEMYDQRDQAFPHKIAWNVKFDGRATDKNLARWIQAYTDSLKVDGANKHISKALGYMPIPFRAWIVDQRTGATVARWIAPAFMLV